MKSILELPAVVISQFTAAPEEFWGQGGVSKPQRRLHRPTLPQRIATVSSPTKTGRQLATLTPSPISVTLSNSQLLIVNCRTKSRNKIVSDRLSLTLGTIGGFCFLLQIRCKLFE